MESWEPSQHLLSGTGKPRKTSVEVTGRRTFRILTFVCLCNRDLFVISLKMVVYSPKHVGVSVTQILLLVPVVFWCCTVSVGGHFSVCIFCEFNLRVAHGGTDCMCTTVRLSLGPATYLSTEGVLTALTQNRTSSPPLASHHLHSCVFPGSKPDLSFRLKISRRSRT